jgi:hypothetical protein
MPHSPGREELGKNFVSLLDVFPDNSGESCQMQPGGI